MNCSRCFRLQYSIITASALFLMALVPSAYAIDLEMMEAAMRDHVCPAHRGRVPEVRYSPECDAYRDGTGALLQCQDNINHENSVIQKYNLFLQNCRSGRQGAESPNSRPSQQPRSQQSKSDSAPPPGYKPVESEDDRKTPPSAEKRAAYDKCGAESSRCIQQCSDEAPVINGNWLAANRKQHACWRARCNPPFDACLRETARLYGN